MPTYQYRCTDCGSELEVQQRITDDALTTCPTCEGELRKVFSPVGITFKGDGFYKTDSRKSSGASSSSSGSSESSSSGSSDGGSSSSGSSTPSTTSGSGSSSSPAAPAKAS